MKLFVVLVVSFALASASSHKTVRSVNEAIRSASSLSPRQDILECASRLPGRCDDLQVPDPSLSDAAAVEAFCDTNCLAPLGEFSRCIGIDIGFAIDLFEQRCARNINGTRCFTLEDTVNQTAIAIQENCLTFGILLPDPLTCPQNCAPVLQRSNGDIGCCISLLNITDFTDIIPVANYSLWTACGVEPPGFCAASAVVHVSSLLVLLTVLLAAVLL